MENKELISLRKFIVKEAIDMISDKAYEEKVGFNRACQLLNEEFIGMMNPKYSNYENFKDFLGGEGSFTPTWWNEHTKFEKTFDDNYEFPIVGLNLELKRNLVLNALYDIFQYFCGKFEG